MEGLFQNKEGSSIFCLLLLLVFCIIKGKTHRLSNKRLDYHDSHHISLDHLHFYCAMLIYFLRLIIYWFCRSNSLVGGLDFAIIKLGVSNKSQALMRVQVPNIM